MVKVTDGTSAFPRKTDIKRDMLIEGIRFFRVVAESVPGSHAQEALCLVQMPGLFPETVEVVVFLDPDGVNPAAVAVFPVAELRDILVDQLPVPIVNGNHKRIFMDHGAKPLSLQHGFLRAVRQAGRDGFNMPAFPGKQCIRPGFPGCQHKAVGGFIPVTVEAGADAQDIVRQKPDAYFRAVRDNGGVVFPLQDILYSIADFHMFFLRMRRCL